MTLTVSFYEEQNEVRRQQVAGEAELRELLLGSPQSVAVVQEDSRVVGVYRRPEGQKGWFNSLAALGN